MTTLESVGDEANGSGGRSKNQATLGFAARQVNCWTENGLPDCRFLLAQMGACE